jgi:hypothetical protein
MAIWVRTFHLLSSLVRAVGNWLWYSSEWVLRGSIILAMGISFLKLIWNRNRRLAAGFVAEIFCRFGSRYFMPSYLITCLERQQRYWFKFQFTIFSQFLCLANLTTTNTMLEETEYRNLQLGTILLQFRSFLNLTCSCLSEISLGVILTSPSSLSSRNFARYFYIEMNYLPARPSHIPASHSCMHSLHNTWLLDEIATLLVIKCHRFLSPSFFVHVILFCFKTLLIFRRFRKIAKSDY